MVTLSDNPALDRMAGEFLRKHRHGVDTSEAYDDLRDLLAVAVRDALWAACRGGAQRASLRAKEDEMVSKRTKSAPQPTKTNPLAATTWLRCWTRVRSH